MNNINLINPVIVFALPFILTVVCTRFIIKFSCQKAILDYPKDKSIHEKPVPMLGGLAIFCAFFISCLIMGSTMNLFPLFLALVPIIVGGIYDDIKSMNASQKLLTQFISSVIVVSFGVVITNLKIPFGPIIKLSTFSIPATIFWFMFMTNLLNIIDGLDGLAVGLSAIIFLILLNFAWPMALSAQLLILFSTSIAFLLFNFHPSKIFLGNNGSTFLGFTIAYFALVTSQKSTIIPILILPCTLLVVHIGDITYAILRRTRKKVSIFKGDKRHIHHIMLNVIGNHRVTVLVFYLVSLILASLILRLTG